MNNLLLYFGWSSNRRARGAVRRAYAVDWNGYRGVFEEEASRMLAARFGFRETSSVRLLPSPYVHAEKLRIGGAVGEETGRPLFRAEGFTRCGSPCPPLLKGILEARDVQIVKPLLELAIDAEGRTTLASLKVAPGRFSFVPQDIAFRSVTVIDGSVGLSGPNGVELARFDGVNGDISADTIDGPTAIAAPFCGTARSVTCVSTRPRATPTAICASRQASRSLPTRTQLHLGRHSAESGRRRQH